MRNTLALSALCTLLCACVNHTGLVRPAAQPESLDLKFQVEHDVVYTPPGWPEAMHADLYLPQGMGPFPGIVAVHGGGWDGRDRSDMDSISRKLARRGYIVANIDYRLAPKFLHPAQLEDTREAVKWLRTQGARLNLDAARIGGWGYSAGAHLIALAATDISDPAARLQAVVAGGIPSDLPHYPMSPIITPFIGATYAQAPNVWIQASPARRVTAQTPPMFLYHGTWDRLVYVEDAETMKAALDRAGVPAELYLVRGSGHITTFLFGFGAEAAGMDFLDRVLRVKPKP